jgi:hypothetical protein
VLIIWLVTERLFKFRSNGHNVGSEVLWDNRSSPERKEQEATVPQYMAMLMRQFAHEVAELVVGRLKEEVWVVKIAA